MAAIFSGGSGKGLIPNKQSSQQPIASTSELPIESNLTEHSNEILQSQQQSKELPPTTGLRGTLNGMLESK